jgi:hypothetical protein
VQPQFPQFKPIQLEDRGTIQGILDAYQPDTSEWTFTNLFIWRSHYGFQWCLHRDWLVVLSSIGGREPCLFQPVGPSGRAEIVHMLLRWLREKRRVAEPRMERADGRLISELQSPTDLIVEPTRDHFDYLYRTPDLIALSGRKYHSKKNHLNKFRSEHVFTYEPMAERHVGACLDLAETWCRWRRCEEDMGLLDEWEAVDTALKNLNALRLQGGVILTDGRVVAFALGELLNPQTAVVHVEKADPEIPELYAVINQQCCENLWPNVPFVNREQDLGEPGLRKAKLSYNPDRFAEKFRVRLVDGG